MKFTLVPEYRFDRFNDVTADFLVSIGVRGVLLDIDNTMEPYEHSKPGAHVISWLNSLREANIKTAIVSNNDAERVEIFNEEIGMPAYYKAGKPFPKYLKNAMVDIGSTKETTIFIGDQGLTDVWAAPNAGIRAILGPPINDKKDALTRFKRLLEKPILKLYDKGRKK